MPPKVTEQAVKFAEALERGTPNRKKIAMTVAADRVRELSAESKTRRSTEKPRATTRPGLL